MVLQLPSDERVQQAQHAAQGQRADKEHPANGCGPGQDIHTRQQLEKFVIFLDSQRTHSEPSW
jgi:hypothetical protein